MAVPRCASACQAGRQRKTTSSEAWRRWCGWRGTPLLPMDLRKDRPKAFAFSWIDRLDKPHTAFQVRPKAGVGFPVLALRTQANTVGERRLETIEVRAPDVDSLVGDEACQVLSHSLAHDARLSMLHRKTLFHQDHGNVRGETVYAPREFLAAGECEVIGVTRVLGAGRAGQAGQAAIEPIGAQIRERRGGRRALGQMRSR